jgi:hypothetical protein
VNNVVYLLKEAFRLGQSQRTICLTPESVLDGRIDKGDLESTFGGWITYVDDQNDTEYLGVWGTRNASRFRAMLKRKEIDFVLKQTRHASIRLSVRHVRAQ